MRKESSYGHVVVDVDDVAEHEARGRERGDGEVPVPPDVGALGRDRRGEDLGSLEAVLLHPALGHELDDLKAKK